jgi:hypothetical protein
MSLDPPVSRFPCVPTTLTSMTLTPKTTTPNAPAPTGRYNPAQGNALGAAPINSPALKGRHNGNEEVRRTAGFNVEA